MRLFFILSVLALAVGCSKTPPVQPGAIPAGAVFKVAFEEKVVATVVGGQSKSLAPTPLRLKVVGYDDWTKSYRDAQCSVTAEAYGSLAAKRASVHSLSLTCTLDGGKTLAIPLQAYVADDDDGKAGIKGKVVGQGTSHLIPAIEIPAGRKASLVVVKGVAAS